MILKNQLYDHEFKNINEIVEYMYELKKTSLKYR